MTAKERRRLKRVGTRLLERVRLRDRDCLYVKGPTGSLCLVTGAAWRSIAAWFRSGGRMARTL